MLIDRAEDNQQDLQCPLTFLQGAYARASKLFRLRVCKQKYSKILDMMEQENLH